MKNGIAMTMTIKTTTTMPTIFRRRFMDCSSYAEIEMRFPHEKMVLGYAIPHLDVLAPLYLVPRRRSPTTIQLPSHDRREPKAPIAYVCLTPVSLSAVVSANLCVESSMRYKWFGDFRSAARQRQCFDGYDSRRRERKW